MLCFIIRLFCYLVFFFIIIIFLDRKTYLKEYWAPLIQYWWHFINQPVLNMLRLSWSHARSVFCYPCFICFYFSFISCILQIWKKTSSLVKVFHCKDLTSLQHLKKNLNCYMNILILNTLLVISWLSWNGCVAIHYIIIK